MNSLIEQIEDAIIAAIREALPDVKTVESYAGQLESDLPKLTSRMPAVFVLYGGDVITRDGYGDATHALRFTTMVACKDLRGKRQARTKDGGAYEIIAGVEAALTDSALGLVIDSLTAQRTDLVFASGSVVVYGIEWQTGYTN